MVVQYDPALERWTSAFEAAQGELKKAVDCLFADVGRELAGLTVGARKARALRLLLHHREDEKQCLLVIIGATPEGKKEPLGFWKALGETWPTVQEQRCWIHKTANVLAKLPKNQQPKAKRSLHEIWMAETKAEAQAAFDAFIETYALKYEKAVACLAKDRDPLLVFYNFPAEHWVHLRTTNPIESTFATVRHRTIRAKGCLSNKTALAMVFKLVEGAQKTWCRHNGPTQLPKLIRGVKFSDGLEVDDHQAQTAAA